MCMIDSPVPISVKEGVASKQQEQTNSDLTKVFIASVANRNKTMAEQKNHNKPTTNSAEADLYQLSSLAAPQQYRYNPALNAPLPREVVHQFDVEDFEPNPVFNPHPNINANPMAAVRQPAPVIASSSGVVAVQPPVQQPLQQQSQQQQHQQQQQHPPERLTAALLAAAPAAHYRPPPPAAASVAAAAVPTNIQFAVAPPRPLAVAVPSTAPTSNTTSTTTNTANTTTKPPPVHRRKQFLVFVKILLKHLEKDAPPQLRDRAKQILTDCIQKNRQGHPDFTPLHLAAEARILPLVGPRHWNRCVQYLQLYLRKQQKQGQGQQQQGQSQGQAQVNTNNNGKRPQPQQQQSNGVVAI